MSDKFLIGKFAKPYGLKGEIKMIFYVDSPEELDHYQSFYMKKQSGSSVYYEQINIIELKMLNRKPVAVIDGVNDRTDASKLTGREIYADSDDMPKLTGNSFYQKDLIGAGVLLNGEHFGKIDDLIEVSNYQVLLVDISGDRKKILAVPFWDKYVGNINTIEKLVEIRESVRELM